jgi:hypothetical protein
VELGLGEEEVHHLLKERVEVHRGAVQLHLAGEAEEVVEDVAEPRSLLLDGGEAVDDAGGSGVVPRVGDVLAEELEVELDGGEGVLDLVGQPAGEGAEFGKALGLARLALEAVDPSVRRRHHRGRGGHADETADDDAPGERPHAAATYGRAGDGASGSRDAVTR